MIVFNLDDTLANLDHRRYFVDQEENHPDYYREPCEHCSMDDPHEYHTQLHKATQLPFSPDWESYDNACENDEPIEATASLLKSLTFLGNEIEIWTGRSEASREKTIRWIQEKVWQNNPLIKAREPYSYRMRPLGYQDSDFDLKAVWIQELNATHKKVAMAFESHQSVCELWSRNGVPCFQLRLPGSEEG